MYAPLDRDCFIKTRGPIIKAEAGYLFNGTARDFESTRGGSASSARYRFYHRFQQSQSLVSFPDRPRTRSDCRSWRSRVAFPRARCRARCQATRAQICRMAV
jgi:hypothetical protein